MIYQKQYVPIKAAYLDHFFIKLHIRFSFFESDNTRLASFNLLKLVELTKDWRIKITAPNSNTSHLHRMLAHVQK